MSRALIPLAALLALAGCVPQKQWRSKPFYAAIPAERATGVEERFVIPQDLTAKRLYSFAFVEFKNNGDFWDRKQLDEALHAIDDADQRSGHRAVVVTFIHGWKNNAREDNNNVLDFRRQLNRIAADACKDDYTHCGVVGIFLGWSGDLVSRYANTTRTLTYFDRRDTAIHVATLPIGDALFAVMKQVKTGADREGNLSVVVGHSFGGLVLEYAITKRMKEIGDELHAELGKGTTSDAVRLKSLDDFADLVVLINQAAPAAVAVTLLSQYRVDLQKVNLLRPPKKSNCPAGDSSQECKELTRPLILSISSETDLATKAVLPVAETISPAPNSPPAPTQAILPAGLTPKKVMTTAAAHTPQLYSHQIIQCTGDDCSPCLKLDKYYIPIAITLPAYAPGNNTGGNESLKYCVARDRTAWNRTPYWIFEIPSAIVPDHSTIFTDRFVDFLTAFLPPLDAYRSSRPAPAPLQRMTPSSQRPAQ
jgi:hypothetical protein